MGTWGDAPYVNGSININSGATAGSQSFVLAATTNHTPSFDANTGLSVGGYLLVTELNDPNYVTTSTVQNSSCGYCDTIFGGTRVRGQVVEITSISGTGPYTVGFKPALYSDYGVATGTGPAWATPFGVLSGGAPDVKYAGIENLQLYATGSGFSSGQDNVVMTEAAYSWIKNVESNFTDADHVNMMFAYRPEIRDSYFTSAYGHSSGGSDSDVQFGSKTTGGLVENNIFERLHSSVVLNWGAAGNVIGYNYSFGAFDSGGTNVTVVDFALDHGAHPQFNLVEGNASPIYEPDSVHGSSSHLTLFRNWGQGATTIAPYVGGGYSIPGNTGRLAVDWAHTHLSSQQNRGFDIAFPDMFTNLVGNVSGSAAALAATGNVTYTGGAAPCVSCIVPPAVRTYGGRFEAFNFGYDRGADSTAAEVAALAGGPSNTVGYWVGRAWNTAMMHGNWDVASTATVWDLHYSGSHALPASFYRTSKPSWFGSTPWPAIGPDVSGGVDAGGHVYAIPAMLCYNNTAKDGNGLLQFDANNCYAGAPAQAPAVQLSASNHDFGGQAVGTQSAGFDVTLTNIGTAQLTITSIVASGDFSQTNNCPISPGTLAVSGTCTITGKFQPTATGTRAGSLTITDDAADSPQTISLSGTGLQAATAGTTVFGTGLVSGGTLR